MGIKPPLTATTSIGEYEIALQTHEAPERMILIESTEEDDLKTFFLFEIQGDLFKRAVTVGILRGLIGSFCLFRSDIEAMGHAIQNEFESLIDHGDMKAINSFIILQIDSWNGISYCSESWPKPLFPHARLDDLIAGSNSLERSGLEKGVIELRAQEACYLIPGMKNHDNHDFSSLLNRMLQTICQPSVESPLKLLEIASDDLNRNLTAEEVFSLLPRACIKNRGRKLTY